MTKYSIATQNYLGSGPTIVARVDDQEIPAMTFSKVEKDCPFDINKMAQNFCDLLNGLPPSQKIDAKGYKIFYQGHPSAVTLRYQKEERV